MSELNYTVNLSCAATCRRPEMKIAIDRDPLNEGCPIFIQLGQQMGQPMRWIELKPQEARVIAMHLQTLARAVEQPQDKEEDLDEKVPF